jgi:hypothetical protein
MMPQPFPAYETRQPLRSSLYEFFQRDPVIAIPVQPSEDFLDDDGALAIQCGLGVGVGVDGGGEEGGRVVQAVEGFDLGDGEVVVLVQVV